MPSFSSDTEEFADEWVASGSHKVTLPTKAAMSIHFSSDTEQFANQYFRSGSHKLTLRQAVATNMVFGLAITHLTCTRGKIVSADIVFR